MSSETEPLQDDFHHQLNDGHYSLQTDGHDKGIIISTYEYPRGREYWHARQAFLKSYRFSSSSPPLEEEEDDDDDDDDTCDHDRPDDHDQVSGFKGKLKRSMKSFNESAAGIVMEVRRGMTPQRRLKIRVFRVKLNLHSSLLVLTMRCFIPWFSKVEHVP
ncbi:hypothetical protein BT93_A0080 [Corymbia citriodora subsp. variegata]|nr:hypothetical protein BT93_A0080 [Corymbia citriodora subsp. variegata]